MLSAQQQAKIVEEILILNLSKNAIKFKGKPTRYSESYSEQCLTIFSC